MKNITLATTLVMASLGLSQVAQAEGSVTLGYAQSHLEHFGTLRGANAKYNIENIAGPSVGLMTSFTYLTNDKTWNDRSEDTLNGIAGTTYNHEKITFSQYSLLVGPSFRVSDFVNLYGLVGASYNRAKHTDTDRFVHEGGSNITADETIKGHKTSFAYGVGVQINPIPNLVVDLGYEGTSVKFSGDDGSSASNGFIIGIGYRF